MSNNTEDWIKSIMGACGGSTSAPDPKVDPACAIYESALRAIARLGEVGELPADARIARTALRTAAEARSRK